MFKAKVQALGRKLASNAIARAFAVSLLFHVIGISGIEMGARLHWWKHSVLPQLGKSKAAEEMEKARQKFQEQARQAQQVPEAQLVFVEVDPAQAAPEPPRDAKFYSTQNTLASNPEVAEKETAKVDGQQEQVVKTFDTLRPNHQPLQPAPQPKPEPPQKAQAKTEPSEQKAPRPVLPEDPKPEREQKPGETLLARAAPRPQPPQASPPEEKRRPRTVAEAKAQKGIIEGQKSRQAGGVRKHSIAASLDAKATPFGAYDAMFIQAVQARWFSLLDERDFVGGQSGRVVLEFRLNYDGRITALRVAEAEVNEMLSWFCQRAVLDPAPYRPFPGDMRRMLNNDFREVRFTFYYNQ